MDAAVHTFLQEADLQQFAEPLQNLGVQKLEDLKDLETDDFQEIGMKKLQKRRFDRALESQFGEPGVPVNEPDPKRQRVSAPEKPVARPTIATSSASKLEQADAEVEDGRDAHLPVSPENEAPAMNTKGSPGEMQTESPMVIACEHGQLDADFLQHVNSLGAGHEEDWEVVMSDADPQESMAGRGSHFSQLISLQTDLQDAMHVAKPVTSSEELLSLCNLICPGSTQTIPKVKVDWQKLRSAGELPVQGVLGEPELIRAFLESLQIQPQALTSLKSFGLYALHHQDRILLVLWTGDKSWWDKSHRRALVSFVHFVLQLAKHVYWLVGQKDLDAVKLHGREVQTRESSRNMDIQISMMAASDDDCTLGAHFCAGFGLGDSIDAVRLFSGKQCASVSQLRVQAAGLQLVKKVSLPTTITNFFRDFKETHAICFHPDLKIEKCQVFLEQVAPEMYESISKAHQQKVQEFELQMGERRKAIFEAEVEKKEAVVTQLKEAIDGHILQHFPLEFFALKTGEVNCSICWEELNANSVALKCDPTHIFHRDCIQDVFRGKCPICRHDFGDSPVGAVTKELVDGNAAAKLAMQFPSQPSQAHSLAGNWHSTCLDGYQSQRPRPMQFAIQEQGSDLQLKLVGYKGKNLVGYVNPGTGFGSGYLYAPLFDQAKLTNKVLTVRLKQVDDESELRMWAREWGGSPWGAEWKAIRSSTGASFDSDSAMKQAKTMVQQVRFMYAFALLAQSRKWLPTERTFDVVAQEMLVSAFKDEKGSFCEWYDCLAPSKQEYLVMTRRMSKEEVKALIVQELQAFMPKSNGYVRVLQLCKHALQASFQVRVEEMAGLLLRRMKQPDISQKTNRLDDERKAKQLALDAEWRRSCSSALETLAPENAKKVTLHNMTFKYGNSFAIDHEIEMVGAPKLFCKMQRLTIQKDTFEQALSEGSDFKPNLERVLPVEVELASSDPSSVSLLSVLGQDKAFSAEFCDNGSGIKFYSQSRVQGKRTLLHIKRAIHAVAFSETLRMLAVYSSASKTVAVFAWDEHFSRHSEYCSPIELEIYQENALLFEMHFLTEPKQLCFVFQNNAVKVFELISKSVRPRGFNLEPHVRTFVDSTGVALMALREQTLPNSEPPQQVWSVDVFLTADGRKIKTLEIPVPSTHGTAGVGSAPVVDILKLYGVDFLVLLDTEKREIHGWQFKLQTAEQVCSMQQLDNSANLASAKIDSFESCFDILYQVLSKFTSQPALASGDCSQNLQTDQLTVLGPGAGAEDSLTSDLRSYIGELLSKLRLDTQKPALENLKLDVSFMPVEAMEHPWSSDAPMEPSGQRMSFSEFVRKVICMVPLQIARAENEAFVLLKDGLREDVGEFGRLSELADFISFGLYETILETNENPVVVISSMGKQSTGKSYMLNHLAGTCFDTSGGRCTDGIWMIVREFASVTYVLLDFEGLGSFERSAQEDMLLSVFNAAISHVSLFRTENRLDCDTANIFSRMQQGAKLIQGDDELFNGAFQIVVKDVVSDAKEVAEEFRQKIQHIIARDKEDNFFLRLYKGRVGILPFPALGRSEFYREFATLTNKVRHAQDSGRCFESGNQFLRNTKLLMAKMAMKDWTPTDQNKIKMLLADLSECLAAAVMAGCMAMTEDGPAPLLHLRNNKKFVMPAPMATESDSNKEQRIDRVLSALPDEGLLLALVSEQDGTFDVQVTCEIMTGLLGKIKTELQCSLSPEEMSDILRRLAERRQVRIVSWLEENLQHIAREGDAQRLMTQTKTMLARLLQQLQLCKLFCLHCKLPCFLPVGHSDGAHDCGTNHKCQASCSYCEESGIHGKACTQPAGHGGGHDCGDASHTCGEMCSLSDRGNCSGRCVLKPGHSADEPHMCGTTRHHCGKQCSLPGCPHTCVLPHDLMHDRCECHVIVCPNKCSFPKCSFMCSEQDHFHSNGEDSCMCSHPHQCPHDCDAPGICEIYSELVMKQEKFTGRHDTFDYDAIQTEQNGVRKTCCKLVPPGEREHEGGHIHSTTENLVHYCNEKCPTCGYYCTLPFEHSGEHDTRHGNMRRTYFVSDQDVFTLGSRKYAPSESGVAEMCNMYCHRAGRGHMHVKLCAAYSNGQECCISAMPGRRHSMRRYKPNPQEEKDEFTHEAFWESIGFKDPCSNEDKEIFGKCNHFCAHPSHTEDGEQKSFCTLPLWHDLLSGQESQGHIAQHGGCVSPDGHHFACSHKTSQPVHTIFLIDISGSMSSADVKPQTLPWRRTHPNRLGCALAAVQSFVEKRGHQSPDDVVSLMAFNHGVQNGPTLTPIQRFSTGWLQNLAISGGTSFAAAIDAILPCVRQTPRGHRCMVMFLSDGFDHYPASSMQNLLNSMQRTFPTQPLRFHTVQFPPGDARGKTVLTQMVRAALGGAAEDEFAKNSSFMESIDAVSLQEAFLNVAESLSSVAGGLIVG